MNVHSILHPLFFSLCLLLLGTTPLLAQNPASISPSDFRDYVDHLVCENEADIQISDQRILHFLKQLSAPLSAPDNNCHPPVAEMLQSTTTTTDYQWPVVPCASKYRIASLGLSDGTTQIYETTKNSITLNHPSPQLYLISLLSDTPAADGKDQTIIIADVKLTLTSHTGVLNCTCSSQPVPLTPNYSSEDCAFGIFGEQFVSFDWPVEDVCNFNRYKFTVQGHANGQEFSYDYWFIRDNITGVIHNFLECSPTVPIGVFAVADPDIEESFDFLAVTADLYFSHIDFSLSDGYDGHFTVEGILCDCMSEVNFGGRPRAGKMQSTDPISDWQVFPNPFSEALTIQLTPEKPQSISLQLFDTNGKIVLEETRQVNAGQQQIRWSTEALPAGLYHLQVRAEDQVLQWKNVKCKM